MTHTSPGLELVDVLDVDQRARRGCRSTPRSRARRTFLRIDSPSVATTRPLAMAASAICWMRWMWLAKLAVMIRRPGVLVRTARAAPRRRRARSARGRAPRRWSSRPAAGGCPRSWRSAPMRARSVRRPSTGVRSSLKSPECRITPCGRVHGDGEGVGHRVGDRDELDVERPDLAPLAVGDGDRARCGRAGRPPRCGCGPGRA